MTENGANLHNREQPHSLASFEGVFKNCIHHHLKIFLAPYLLPSFSRFTIYPSDSLQHNQRLCDIAGCGPALPVAAIKAASPFRSVPHRESGSCLLQDFSRARGTDSMREGGGRIALSLFNPYQGATPCAFYSERHVDCILRLGWRNRHPYKTTKT
jgi:hypothetical protein